MKIFLAVLAIIGSYLFGSYAYFYNFLGQQHLLPPPHDIKIIIGKHSDTQTIKYVALGDSLTAGVGTYSYQQSYPYLLAQKLTGSTNVELWNFSQPGARSADVLTQQLTPALAAKPDIATLLIGTNDIRGFKSTAEFENNYQQIVTALKSSGARIYLFSIPDLGSGKIVLFPYNLFWDFRTRQFNQIIRQIAKQYNAVYMDLYPLTKSAQFYSADEFHPSAQGYQEWIDAFNVN